MSIEKEVGEREVRLNMKDISPMTYSAVENYVFKELEGRGGYLSSNTEWVLNEILMDLTLFSDISNSAKEALRNQIKQAMNKYKLKQVIVG